MSDLDVFLGEDIEDLRTVSQETVHHLQYIVCEQRHAQLIDKHLEPFPSGKLPAVPPVSPDHGSQQLVELVVDLNGDSRILCATLLTSFSDEVEREEKHALFLEELLSLSEKTELCLPGVVGV